MCLTPQNNFLRPFNNEELVTIVIILIELFQLSSIFLNVEELTEVNRRFTESLNDVIEIAMDEGDEDLSTVKIGKLFLEASQPMLGAFKSYCTRQVRGHSNDK